MPTKFYRLTLQTMALGLSLIANAAAMAAVTLTAPEEIIIVALDDQEIRTGLLRSSKNNYQLDAGNHTIAVKYEQIFYHHSGEHDVLRSNIVTLNNVTLQDGTNYRLALVNAPKTFEQGQEFAKQPTIAVLNAQGQIVAQQTGANSEAKSWFGNKLFGGNYDLRQKSTAPSTAAPVVITQTSAPVAIAPTAIASAGSRDQQLIELWKNATPQERQKFTAWLGNQAAQ